MSIESSVSSGASCNLRSVLVVSSAPPSTDVVHVSNAHTHAHRNVGNIQ